MKLYFQLLIAALFIIHNTQAGNNPSSASAEPYRCIILQEPGFPYVETDELSYENLRDLFAGLSDQIIIEKNSFDEFHRQKKESIDLLIWPYGSAMTEKVWSDIFQYLQSGGNIFVPGGRPFSIDVAWTEGKYVPARVTNRFTEQLQIYEAFKVATSTLKTIVKNSEYDFLPDINNFHPQQAFSLLGLISSAKLGSEDLRGNVSCHWKTLVSATDDSGENSIPLISLFDRYEGDYIGGRWLFFTFTPQDKFWQTIDGKKMLKEYITYALQKPVKIDVAPEYAFYQPNEKVRVPVKLHSFNSKNNDYSLGIEIFNGDAPVEKTGKLAFTSNDKSFDIDLKKPVKAGLYKIVLSLSNHGQVVEKRVAGFVCDSFEKLNTGAQFSANTHFLTRGGVVYPIAGMTYMDSEVHRYFLTVPNPVRWNEDMARMKADGINMIRTGIWKWHPYEIFMDENGNPNEKTLRALDAFLLTAKKHDIPVQFCIYPFQPQAKDSKAPFTDDAAFALQKKYISILVQRYKNNRDIIWDLINEPTYGLIDHLWSGNIPTNSESEKTLWNQWLKNMYDNDVASLAGKTNMTREQLIENNDVKLPNDNNFQKNNVYDINQKPLLAYDYNLFAQYAYNVWSGKIRSAIRETGSAQLVITGQDEGGVSKRILSHFYVDNSDFSTMHSWWQDDDLLWDNLMAKTQGKPMLVQETNVMRYTDLREIARRNETEYVKIFERKICMGLGAEGAGVMPWIWNANPLLNENESSIGINRCDGTASPEKAVYKKFARFVTKNAGFFSEAKNADIMMVVPFSLQLSADNDIAQTITKNAIRALHYYARLNCISASEYHLSRTNYIPELIILPSAMILTDEAWENLLGMVSKGSTLLITGPIDRDPHFEDVSRLSKLGVKADHYTITQLASSIQIGDNVYPLNYYGTMPFKDYDKMIWNDDHGKVKMIDHGKGKILVTEYPCELNTDMNTTASLYKYAAEVAGIKPSFTTTCKNNGILIRPMDYKKARLYLLVSETDRAETFTIKDMVVNKEYNFTIEPGRAKLILISKEDGHVVDEY